MRDTESTQDAKANLSRSLLVNPISLDSVCQNIKRFSLVCGAMP